MVTPRAKHPTWIPWPQKASVRERLLSGPADPSFPLFYYDGHIPVYHNVHNNGTYTLAPQQVTLAEVLKDSGFKTAAFVASFSVDSRFGLNQGFDVYDDDLQPGLPFKTPNSERRAEQVVSVFTSWLEKNSGEHFFVWVHLFDPHLPYQPPPPYREQFADSPYDGEIAYMDSQIGALVEKLKEKKILDRTLIVLAGDHGEAFGEKVETGHGVFLYDGTMRVPLIFYGENHLPAEKVVRGRVRLIDIMPSILDLLGLPKMGQTQGKSLIPCFTGKENKDLESYIETFYPRENYGWSELTGLIRGDWKYIRAPRPELYNLKSDPKENGNVFGSTPKIASEMASGLETLIKESAGILGASNRTLTAAEEERLRALGYTSFSGGGTKSSYPDPKDKLDILRLTQQAGAYEFEKNYDQAEAVYEKILALVPDSPASYVNLALSQARSNRYEESIQTLKREWKESPNPRFFFPGWRTPILRRDGSAKPSMRRPIFSEPTPPTRTPLRFRPWPWTLWGKRSKPGYTMKELSPWSLRTNICG